MGGGGVSAFFLVFSWEISKGKGGGRWREEDKLKSAKRIKSFCHDIVFFENGVFGRWKLLDMNKNVEKNSWIIRSFALKNDCGMPKILFLASWGNLWQDFWQDLGKGIMGEGGGMRWRNFSCQK